MNRFYTKEIDKDNGLAIISGDDVNHMRKVLRLNIKDLVTVCDYNKTDYVCEIMGFSQTKAELKIISQHDNMFEPPINITLYQALPKSDKLDYIIQKCVELGVVRIVPILTKRCVVKSSNDEKKLLRRQKIADEAAKQCGRGVKVIVDKVKTFIDAVLSAEKESIKIIPYECEKNNSLKNALHKSISKNISVFIGPEGGFDESEIKFAKDNGFCAITLGPRILRTETAPIAVISACMFELGDW